MPFIQIEVTDEEDELLRKAAALNRRSKREQVAFSAIQDAIQKTQPLAPSDESNDENDPD